MIPDFDQVIERGGTGSEKYDARQRLFGRADVTPLWVADMDFAAPACVTEAVQARAQHPIYGYSVVPERLFHHLLHWLKQRHQWQPARDELMLSPGVVPALYACVHALTQPGDGIIVMPPVYPPLLRAVTDNDRRVVLNPLLLRESNTAGLAGKNTTQHARYEIDWDGLERCAAQAKMLLFCSPHNPVGRVWSRQELTRLLAIAERYDLIIVSDEIHADLTFTPHTVLATLPGASARVITTMAPSKTFNMPGLGLAWLAVPNVTQRQAIAAQYAKLAIGVNNPLSLVATEAAYGHGHAWLDALLAYVKITHDAVVTRLAAHPQAPQAIAAEGTYLLWLDCRHLGLSDSELMQHCVEKAGLGLSAGPYFGDGGHGFLRMNVAAPRAVILAAVDRLIANVAPPAG